VTIGAAAVDCALAALGAKAIALTTNATAITNWCRMSPPIF
jgi:hypothetical protein